MSRKKGSSKTGGIKKGGKHKKTIQKEMALELMQKEILKRMFEKDGLLQKKIELANGIYVMKPIRVGGVVVDVKVYKERPDSNSLEYLFSMLVGKPKESLDVEIGASKELLEAIEKQTSKIAGSLKEQKKDTAKKIAEAIKDEK